MQHSTEQNDDEHDAYQHRMLEAHTTRPPIPRRIETRMGRLTLAGLVGEVESLNLNLAARMQGANVVESCRFGPGIAGSHLIEAERSLKHASASARGNRQILHFSMGRF